MAKNAKDKLKISKEVKVCIKKVTLILRMVLLVLLLLIAGKMGIFTDIIKITFISNILNNTYVSGVLCSIIAVIIVYKWQVWYCKKRLKQDIRCNECIRDIYHGIETACKYALEVDVAQEYEDDDQYECEQKYVTYYKRHQTSIETTNLELCDDRNDLLIDSIQSCFFINLNFELLGIVNSVKTELMDLRREYPKIIRMVEQSDAVTDEKMMTQLNDMLCDYFMELKLMAGYWKRLLDYLQYDPTFINLFVKTYNERYKERTRHPELPEDATVVLEHEAGGMRESK